MRGEQQGEGELNKQGEGELDSRDKEYRKAWVKSANSRDKGVWNSRDKYTNSKDKELGTTGKGELKSRGKRQ